MLRKIIRKMNKARHDMYKKSVDRNKLLLYESISRIEDFITFCDEIQTIDNLQKTEAEKKYVRDRLVNYKREAYKSKIKELDIQRKELSNSNL